MQSNGKICLIKNIATILLFAVSFSANCETKNPYFYQPTDIMSQTNQASEILSQEVISDGWSEASFGRGFLESTYLIEAVQGTEMSRRINDIRYQSYENAYGQKISMYKFYKTNWTDARFNWLTQIDKDYGIIWGFSTGERGRKYNINPSVTIGFLRQFEIDSRTTFSIRLSTPVSYTHLTLPTICSV